MEQQEQKQGNGSKMHEAKQGKKVAVNNHVELFPHSAVRIMPRTLPSDRWTAERKCYICPSIILSISWASNNCNVVCVLS